MRSLKRRIAPNSAVIGSARIDRRRILTGTAAGLAQIALDGTVRSHAATSPHSFRHGAFEITVVSDGHFVLPPPGIAADVGFLYPDTPRPELEAFLKGMGLPIDRVQNRFRYAAQTRLIRGNHTWTLGLEIARLQINGRETSSNRGVLSFTNEFGHDALTNFLLDRPGAGRTG